MFTIGYIFYIIVTIVLRFGSILFAFLINFLLNSNKWKKDILEKGWFINRFYKLLFLEKVIPESCKVIKDITLYYIINEEGKHYYADDGEFYKSKKFTTGFSTEEKALDYKNNTYKSSSNIKKFLGASVVLDIIAVCMMKEPFMTGILVAIVTLCWSVRWISGKLADNTFKTENNSERLDKLEEKG